MQLNLNQHRNGSQKMSNFWAEGLNSSKGKMKILRFRKGRPTSANLK